MSKEITRYELSNSLSHRTPWTVTAWSGPSYVRPVALFHLQAEAEIAVKALNESINSERRKEE